MANREVTLKLNLDAAGIQAGSSQTAAAFDVIDRSLLSQQQHIVGIKAQLADTSGLRERVKLTIEQEKAQRELNKAIAEERRKQSYEQKGVIGKGLSWLGIGNRPGGADGGQQAGPTQALAGLGTAAMGAVTGLIALRSVSLASPGAMEKFQIVMEDTAAVVGRTLTPILEIVTQAFKLIGDVLASILPSAGDMREALKPISDLFGAIREALAPIAPFIKDVLVVALKALGVVIEIILLPFKLLGKLISALFGGEDKKLKDSTGTAARNISFTSADAHAKSVYQAAFKSGAPGQDKSSVPGWLEKIHGVLDWIGKVVSGIAGKMKVAKDILSFRNLRDLPETFKYQKKGKALRDVEMPRQQLQLEMNIIKKLNRRKGAVSDQERTEMIEFLKSGPGGRQDADTWLRDQIDQAKRRAIDGHPGSK